MNALDVEYAVLSLRMFERLNPAIDSVVTGNGDELTWEVESVIGGRRVRCGRIPAAMCAGHFPGRPAAPVAVVMGMLCRSAGEAMLDHLGAGDQRYRIEAGDVTATALAQAGQSLSLEARYDGDAARGHRVRGVATADGVVVGELDATMSVQPPAPPPTPFA